MTAKNPKVDYYFTRVKKWREELEGLRRILLDCGLVEEVKWGKPCYTFEKSNVAILYGLKEFCGIGFFKGSLLKDPEGVLIQLGENTQAVRVFKVTSTQEIIMMENTIKSYVNEAVGIEKAGLTVNFKKITEFTVPEELQKKLDADPALKTAFKALTPGRQRGYMLYISQAKQSKTREARVEKCLPRILEGKGLHG